MMAKCAGGDLPGHRIVAALQRAKAEREEQFYHTLVNADNLINKQTQVSHRHIATATTVACDKSFDNYYQHPPFLSTHHIITH